MAFYDIFGSNSHPYFIQKLLVRLNRNVLLHTFELLEKTEGPIRVLEIGPGKGYFYRACRDSGRVDYCAFDRCESLLANLEDLPTENKILGEAPEIPDFEKPFDVIYAAFVIEHFADGGRALYQFIRRCKHLLKHRGVIVLMFPNCEKLGFEFWNIDYTHMFPTTKRNVTLAFYDNNISNVRIYDVTGLITHRFFSNRFIYLLSRVMLVPFQYRFFNFFLHYIFGLRCYDPSNLLFKAYGLIKEENLILFGRV